MKFKTSAKFWQDNKTQAKNMNLKKRLCVVEAVVRKNCDFYLIKK